MSDLICEQYCYAMMDHLLSSLDTQQIKHYIAARVKKHPTPLSQSTIAQLDNDIKDFLTPSTPTRGIVDGVFDLAHFGHYNAFRQASKLCDNLIIAVNSSKAVAEAKGVEPIYSNEERVKMASACRWAKEAWPVSEYYISLPILDELKGDFVMHGDDVLLFPNGRHCYQDFIDAGKYMFVK